MSNNKAASRLARGTIAEESTCKQSVQTRAVTDGSPCARYHLSPLGGVAIATHSGMTLSAA